MRLSPVLAIGSATLVTFFVVFTLLEYSPSAAEPGLSASPPPPAATAAPVAPAPDSLAPKIDPAQVAVGVPISGSEALLRNVQPGDRLDILASLVSQRDAQPLTAVLVRGATVVR